MSKDPAFLFYSKDWIEGTAELMPEEKGVFIDLLAHQHQKGSIPSDVNRISRLVGLSVEKFTPIWEQIKDKFVPNGDRLVNCRLERGVAERSSKAHKNKIISAFGVLCRQSGLSASQLSDIKKSFSVDYFLTVETDLITERLTEWFTKQIDKRQPSLEGGNENGTVNAIKNEKGGKGEKPTNPEVSEIIQELNDLAGRNFEADSKYVSKHVEARLKEYPKEDLIDMVRLMVYDWKDNPKMERYLRPATLFNAEKCADYITEMKRHRQNGTRPRKEKGGGKTLIDPMMMFKEMAAKAHQQ